MTAPSSGALPRSLQGTRLGRRRRRTHGRSPRVLMTAPSSGALPRSLQGTRLGRRRRRTHGRSPRVLMTAPSSGASGGRKPAAARETGRLVTRRPAVLCAASLAGLVLAGAAHAGNPQIAGLQVALRAYGLYGGP